MMRSAKRSAMLLELMAMLSFYAISEAAIQRPTTNGNLFAGQLIAKEIDGNRQRERNDTSDPEVTLTDPRVSVLGRNIPPQPLNDYLNSKGGNVDLGMSVNSGDQSRSSSRSATNLHSFDKQNRRMNGTEVVEEQVKQVKSQKNKGNKDRELMVNNKEGQFEKISLAGVEDEATKEDEASEHGFSIKESEVKMYIQQLTHGELQGVTRIDGPERLASASEGAGTTEDGEQKQFHQNVRLLSQGAEKSVPVKRKTHLNFQFQEALPREKVFPLKKLDGEKHSQFLSNPRMLFGNTSDEDAFRNSNEKIAGNSGDMNGDVFSQVERETLSKDTSSSNSSKIKLRYRSRNNYNVFLRRGRSVNKTTSRDRRRNDEEKVFLKKVEKRNNHHLRNNENKDREETFKYQLMKAKYNHTEDGNAMNSTVPRNMADSIPSSLSRRNKDSSLRKVENKDLSLRKVEGRERRHSNSREKTRERSLNAQTVGASHNQTEGDSAASFRVKHYDAGDISDYYYSEDYWVEPDDYYHYGGNHPMDDISVHSLPVPGLISDSTCDCWETDSPHPEVECKCSGPNVESIPANLSKNVSRITVMSASLETLRNDSFTRYRATLRDIGLYNVHDFHKIEAGCFSGLTQLRSIYIHSAPKLKFIRNLTFTEDKLRSLRIVSSGLETVPNLRFSSNEILHMIELDSNRIQRIHSRSLRVRVEELSLSYNDIKQVEREAFSGSYIGKLSLKGNQELTYLHPDAFEGIGSLRTLDLSETSITSLPTVGLKELEVLRLENTPTLKVFPSVYSFRTIKEAHLTYPYHCCAFQFPEQHKKEQYVSHQKMKELEEKHCSELASPSPPMVQTTRIRQRRYAPHPPPVTVPTVDGFLSSMPSPGGDTERLRSHRDPSSPKEEEEEERWGSVRSVSLSGRPKFVTSRDPSVHYDSTRWKQLPKSTYYSKSHQRYPDTVYSLKKSVKGVDLERVAPTGNTVKRNNNFFLVNGADAISKVSKSKHYGPRHRRSKTNVNTSVPDSLVGHDEIKGTSLIPVRHQMKQRSESPKVSHAVKHSRSSRRETLPSSNKKPESKPIGQEDSLLDETLDPEVDNNFGTEEIPLHHGGFVDNFAEPVASGPGEFQSHFLGFGPFNHTPYRYPVETFKQNETSVGVWGDPEHFPGYGDHSEQFGFHEEELIDEGSFHEKGFTDETHETGLKNEDDTWHIPRAEMNNTTIIVLCGNLSRNYHDVMCVPAPDAFNPCEDIMGNLALRVAVWCVVVTAVFGNLAVMLVLVSSKFRMTVSKFLMVNLALADLSMGIYLLIIASMDLHTIGVYFNYAIDWQNGPGCKVAGFLTVFASELSIFTLTVITSERWYAITYAIHLNKRLKLSMAAKIMVVGWIYSITMATLPLVGISGYSKTSICLPMETGNVLALTYLISLLLVNGLAFIVITACYASMYCSISRHDASASHSDLTVAKRMALLVFTDFACWAPIAFFGLTAVAGIPLINVTRAKILLVFFYPLNSCANPYLYAILTKQYRRDLFILLARYGFCTKKAMRYKGAYSSVNNTFPHNTVVNAGPNHRNSTLTQITLCDLTRVARSSQQSNSGSLPGTAAIGGSQDSLQKNTSPSRTPTKPETCTGDSERLSTVQEMSHSTHSDDDTSEYCQQQLQKEEVKHVGSPHPLKNCYARLAITPHQEEILKHALTKSKAKKSKKVSPETDNEIFTTKVNDTEERRRSDCSPPCQGETIVMYEVEIHKDSSPQEVNKFSNCQEEEEEDVTSRTEATSSV